MKLLDTLSRAALACLMTASLSLAVLAQDPPKDAITAEQKQEVLGRIEKIITETAYVPGTDFSKWPELVAENKEKIEKATTDEEFAATINGLMGSYGFSHISLFTPDYGVVRTTQKRAGIGIRIQIEEGGVRVVAIFPNSPASDAGLREGDLIVECDGKVVKGVAELMGESGQASKIALMRGDKRLEFEIVRREYSTVIPETLEWHGTIAHIKIPSFDAGYSKDNVDKLMTQVAEKATGLILDLRGNGGGRVTNLQHLAGYFLDPTKEPMGTFIGKSQVTAYEKDHEPTKDLAKIAEFSPYKVRSNQKGIEATIHVPVTVLVDGGTGSASEMMAAALQEIKGSKVIGSKSAGAVLASIIVPLGDQRKYWIQIPLTDYITIKGKRLEGNGVTPDIATDAFVYGQPDKALEAAIAALKGN